MEINPQRLIGNSAEGWALDFHTSESRRITDESGNIIEWETKRPLIAEELYRLKYWREQYRVERVAKIAAEFLDKYKSKWQLNLIIPIPPSDTTRKFQPVYEIAKSIGQRVALPVDFDTLKKLKPTSELKNIEEPEKRKEILKDAFSIDAEALMGKNMLFFDDIYRSGETLKAACRVVINQGKARNVYVLTITKTRSKR